MNVTDVRLKGMEDKGKLKAVGSITLDDSFVVTGVSVIEGSKGLFVSLPSVKGNDGKYHDTAYPLSKELRDVIHHAVISEYQKSRDLDRIIETVELGIREQSFDEPFTIAFKEPEPKPDKAEKTSIKDKLKNAAEKVSAQTAKNNEKVKEASL